MTAIVIGLALAIAVGAVGALLVRRARGERTRRPATAGPGGTTWADAEPSDRTEAAEQEAYVLELDGHRLLLENAQDRGAREEQQDAFGFTDPAERELVARRGILVAVADGMGGLAFGREASGAAVEAFLAAYRSDPSDGRPIDDALLGALEAANRAVLDLAARRGAEGGVGTTLAAIAVHRGHARWVAVGDTRIYLFRRSSLHRLSADHSYGAQLDERGSGHGPADGSGGAATDRHADRGRLTSYLGLERLPAIERSVEPMPIEQGDRLLVCTDGLLHAMTEAEIADVLRRCGAGAANALVDAARARALPAQDNITAVLITCEAP